MMDKAKRIKELINILNGASKVYYSGDSEIISNFEYDALYDELLSLEAETGIILSNSPTQNVGYEAADGLIKERHEFPMLSLDKTKDPQALAQFLGDKKGLLSWKMDGLTVVLTYENGILLKAVTRGNGEIGEVVTANAKTFVNLPLKIPFKGKLILRGEAVIKYSDFERINSEIADAQSRYKNPRNLCSGAVRQLDSAVTAKRCVNFIAFSLESAVGTEPEGADINAPGKNEAGKEGAEGLSAHSAALLTPDFKNSNEEKFIWLKGQGFDVVPYKTVTGQTTLKAVEEYEEEIKTFDYPSDGLVMLLDDIAYGKSLGLTAKFPRNSIAFKWKDEIAPTKLLEVEWSPSRTGLINPVAVFEPVELEGTTVSRASLHNVSILKGLKLGTGDTVTVYKANMIIPQIAENLTGSDNLEIPDTCPACGGKTLLKCENDVQTLVCPNPLCPAKKIKSFSDFVSRNAMNIDGISEETLEKFIGHGFIYDFSDIYHLDEHKDKIINMQGFGEKSYNNIIESVNISRNTTPERLLNALGISGIGSANAKVICRYFKGDFNKIMKADEAELTRIEGIGNVLAKAITDYFGNEANLAVVNKILAEITFVQEGYETGNRLEGLTFVITGSLNRYANRDELKAEIESKGAKVAGSVSKKTSYLINNDALSDSSKNKKAKELGVPVITEEQYIEMFA